MSLKVLYKDVPPGIKKDLIEYSINDANTALSKISLLKSDEDDDIYYAAVEQKLWKLDGTFSTVTPKKILYWGKHVSSDEYSDEHAGYLIKDEADQPITVTILRKFQNKHRCSGLTVSFSRPDYCTHMRVTWYSYYDEPPEGYEGEIPEDGEYPLVEQDFYPNRSDYFCEIAIDEFDKIKIECFAMNKPNRAMKILAVDDGMVRKILDDSLYSVDVYEEMSLISQQIPADTLSLTLGNFENAQYVFQNRQALYLFQDNSLMGTYYIDSSKRVSDKKYSLTSTDFKGLMDLSYYMGGIWIDEGSTGRLTPIRLIDLLKDIFAGEHIELDVDDGVANTLVTGYIPICSKREALCQVLLATGTVCRTSRSNHIQVYKLDDELHEISDIDNTIYAGAEIEKRNKVTEVKLYEYSYALDTQFSKRTVYQGELKPGRNIIQFTMPVCTTLDDSPTRRLEIGASKKHNSDENDFVSYYYKPNDLTRYPLSGVIHFTEAHVNYCIIDADETFMNNPQLNPYVEFKVAAPVYIESVSQPKSRINPKITMDVAENIVEVKDVKLISANNSDAVLDNVFNYFMQTDAMVCTMPIGDLYTGMRVQVKGDWGDVYTGRIESIDADIKNRLIGKVKVRLENEVAE